MKRAVAFAVALLVVSAAAASVSADTPNSHTWILCNHSSRYTHKPKACQFHIGGGVQVSVHRMHWRHWGGRHAIAHGKSNGRRVRVAARDRTGVNNCTGQVRTDWFYEKATLHYKGKTRHVKRSSLQPQCNNP